MNSSSDQDQAALGGIRQQQWLSQNGLEGTAEVLSIIDTGTSFKQEAVFILTLKIQPARIALAFETTGKMVVSRVAAPRVGDRIKVKYNPANPTQFVAI
jgi:hypothetical protein